MLYTVLIYTEKETTLETFEISPLYTSIGKTMVSSRKSVLHVWLWVPVCCMHAQYVVDISIECVTMWVSAVK